MKNRPLISFDWALKKLLRQKANFAILEGFLSTLLGRDIIIESLPESESNADEQDDKINKVDILCKETNGYLILIELQFNSETDYFHRMLFGASKIITDYMQEGFTYQQVSKVISVNIVYFDLGHGLDYVYYGSTSFFGLHHKDILALSAHQRNLFAKDDVCQIYPEYYIIKVNKFTNETKDKLDEWIYYFKNNDLPEQFSAKGLNLVTEKLNYEQMDKTAKALYDAHQKELRISYDVLETAKYEGMVEGMEKGLEKGIEQGIEKGLEQGIEKGKADLITSIYKNGVDIHMISNITQYSEEEILAILKKAGVDLGDQ